VKKNFEIPGSATIQIVSDDDAARTVDKLPDDYAILVGRMGYAFSELEHNLKMSIYELAEADEVVGRIAIGTGRVGDQLQKLETC